MKPLEKLSLTRFLVSIQHTIFGYCKCLNNIIVMYI